MANITTAGNDPERALLLAQLQNIQLENEKLTSELAISKKGRPWYQLLIQMVPMVTALVALAGFWWGVVQYKDQQPQNRNAQVKQSLREKDTVEREFMRPWLESQREIYLHALSAAATIANSEDHTRQNQATEEFWQLYHGKMILVETKSVSGAMKAFGNCLSSTEACDRNEMNARCRALATAMAARSLRAQNVRHGPPTPRAFFLRGNASTPPLGW